MQKEQMRVSISLEKELVVMPVNNEEVKVQGRKESNTSFFNPAINLARRISMRITGQRGGLIVNWQEYILCES